MLTSGPCEAVPGCTVRDAEGAVGCECKASAPQAQERLAQPWSEGTRTGNAWEEGLHGSGDSAGQACPPPTVATLHSYLWKGHPKRKEGAAPVGEGVCAGGLALSSAAACVGRVPLSAMSSGRHRLWVEQAWPCPLPPT